MASTPATTDGANTTQPPPAVAEPTQTPPAQDGTAAASAPVEEAKGPDASSATTAAKAKGQKPQGPRHGRRGARGTQNAQASPRDKESNESGNADVAVPTKLMGYPFGNCYDWDCGRMSDEQMWAKFLSFTRFKSIDQLGKHAGTGRFKGIKLPFEVAPIDLAKMTPYESAKKTSDESAKKTSDESVKKTVDSLVTFANIITFLSAFFDRIIRSDKLGQLDIRCALNLIGLWSEVLYAVASTTVVGRPGNGVSANLLKELDIPSYWPSIMTGFTLPLAKHKVDMTMGTDRGFIVVSQLKDCKPLAPILADWSQVCSEHGKLQVVNIHIVLRIIAFRLSFYYPASPNMIIPRSMLQVQDVNNREFAPIFKDCQAVHTFAVKAAEKAEKAAETKTAATAATSDTDAPKQPQKAPKHKKKKGTPKKADADKADQADKTEQAATTDADKADKAETKEAAKAEPAEPPADSTADSPADSPADPPAAPEAADEAAKAPEPSDAEEKKEEAKPEDAA